MEETKNISVLSQPAKIEISTNAKGQHQWDITIYGEDMNEDLLKKALDIDEKLTEKFKEERQ